MVIDLKKKLRETYKPGPDIRGSAKTPPESKSGVADLRTAMLKDPSGIETSTPSFLSKPEPAFTQDHPEAGKITVSDREPVHPQRASAPAIPHNITTDKRLGLAPEKARSSILTGTAHAAKQSRETEVKSGGHEIKHVAEPYVRKDVVTKAPISTLAIGGNPTSRVSSTDPAHNTLQNVTARSQGTGRTYIAAQKSVEAPGKPERRIQTSNKLIYGGQKVNASQEVVPGTGERVDVAPKTTPGHARSDRETERAKDLKASGETRKGKVIGHQVKMPIPQAHRLPKIQISGYHTDRRRK